MDKEVYEWAIRPYEISKALNHLLKAKKHFNTSGILTAKDAGDFYGLIAKCTNLIDWIKNNDEESNV